MEKYEACWEAASQDGRAASTQPCPHGKKVNGWKGIAGPEAGLGLASLVPRVFSRPTW